LHSTSGVLDPCDSRLETVRALREWLAVQWHLALDPVAGAASLRVTGCPRKTLADQKGRATPFDPDHAIRRLRAVGARVVPLLSPVYPDRLARLRDPALVMSVRGDLGCLDASMVAIVGSRAATTYGLGVARRLAGELASAGVVIVSGLALGIDAAAHQGALEAGGRTVAVLACGPDRVYPARHRGLAERIARQGAVLSELSPGTSPLPPFFPLRNRLISGLAAAVIVVEARERSGSLTTAGHAANQGIDVFAVPGPITAPTSRGTNRLLRDGAIVVLEAADVLSELSIPQKAWPARARPEAPRPGVGTAPGAAAILSVLEHQPATRDELGRRLGRGPEQLALDLLELELAGRVALDRDGRWHRSE